MSTNPFIDEKLKDKELLKFRWFNFCGDKHSFMIKNIEEISRRNIDIIAEVLKEHISFRNFDFIQGKMETVIFFYHYARLTNQIGIEGYADKLLDHLYSSINNETPLCFEEGVCGVGWGIEHLVQNKLVTANTDEVLAEVDAEVCRIVVHDIPTNLSSGNGVTGYGLYLLSRIKNPSSSNENLRTLSNKHILIKVINEIEILLDECEWKIENVGENKDLLVLLHFLSQVLKERVCYAKTVKIIKKLLINLNTFINNNPGLVQNSSFRQSIERIKEVWDDPDVKLFEILNSFKNASSFTPFLTEDIIQALFISNELFLGGREGEVRNYNVSKFIASYICSNYTIFGKIDLNISAQDKSLFNYKELLMLGLALMSYLSFLNGNNN